MCERAVLGPAPEWGREPDTPFGREALAVRVGPSHAEATAGPDGGRGNASSGFARARGLSTSWRGFALAVDRTCSKGPAALRRALSSSGRWTARVCERRRGRSSAERRRNADADEQPAGDGRPEPGVVGRL